MTPLERELRTGKRRNLKVQVAMVFSRKPCGGRLQYNCLRITVNCMQDNQWSSIHKNWMCQPVRASSSSWPLRAADRSIFTFSSSLKIKTLANVRSPKSCDTNLAFQWYKSTESKDFLKNGVYDVIYQT